MTVGKMAFLSLLVAAYLLMITGSAAGKVIFGPDVFGTSDQCNGTGQHAISSWEDWEFQLTSADPASQLATVTRATDVMSRYHLLDAVRHRALAQGPTRDPRKRCGQYLRTGSISQF
ncbi:uncharacterized protein LOC144118575 isoform X1 [Amblyomma americanum]